MNLLSNISADSLDKMFHCFKPVIREYEPGATIREYSTEISSIGLIMSGKAHLYCIDYDGNYQVIEYFSKNDVFGELFTLPVGSLEYIIEADSKCKVCFIPYTNITTPCSNACDHHVELTRNLFFITAKKSQDLSLRILLMSRKSVRQKMLTYFEYMADTKGSNTFETHVSLSKLASYLSVDRTSLMRELRYLNEEGIIKSSGRKITLL